jgi:hypothetical protein
MIRRTRRRRVSAVARAWLRAEHPRERRQHIKIRWFDAGRRYTLVISRSPGDSHARQKSRAMLKRLLRRPAEKNGG